VKGISFGGGKRGIGRSRATLGRATWWRAVYVIERWGDEKKRYRGGGGGGESLKGVRGIVFTRKKLRVL